MKKLAVASEDGVNISHHFGRSRCFLIFAVEGNQIVNQSLRDNTFTPHAQGECQHATEHHHHQHHHDHDHHHHHGHGAIIQALADCEAVLCYGMGRRAAEDLKLNGIQAFLLPTEMLPADAVKEYLAGNLPTTGGFCRCHD